MENIIKDRANSIRKKLGGVATVYGIPFDINNEDHVLVTAYCMAETDSLKRNSKDIDNIYDLFGGSSG